MSDGFDPKAEEAVELLDAEIEAALSESVRAAWMPSELSPELNELLILQALEDPLAEATEDELAESARLRDALAGEGEHAHAHLARALQAAAQPHPLPELLGERVVRRALPREAKRRRWPLVATGATAVLALAASIALVVRSAGHSSSSNELARQAKELVQSRSTAALFPSKFETGEASLRMDRITAARERDLRENRFAVWGVR
ncbi:MAG: hypothetical protein R3B13_28925 [Polyangiaceae bacterium]